MNGFLEVILNKPHYIMGSIESFVGQIRSSSISIMINTAKGFECKLDKIFANYPDVVKGPCGELRSMAYIINIPSFTHVI